MPTLTPRERETLRLAAEGLGVKETAQRLGVRPSTAHGIAERVRRKAGAPTMAAAVWRMRHELEEPE
jgi:DNA-binding CsgD family transcriptional regulator